MQSKKIVFQSPFQVGLEYEEFNLQDIPADAVVVKNRFTLISAGTDMACLAGHESWFPLPNTPGYTAVGDIVKIGQGVTEFNLGETVFFYGSNRQYQLVEAGDFMLKLPEAIDLKLVPFTRMATIAMTAIRVIPVELGDVVAISGLGLVGNFAMQLARLAGATVIALDQSKERRNLAVQCGADYVLDPFNSDVHAKIMEITHNNGVNSWIEATGVAQVMAEYLPMVASYGDMVLLGTPREKFVTDITPLYRRSHDGQSVNIKGASEWRFPLHEDQYVKHSIARNTNIVFELIKAKKLMVEPLLSHIMKPEGAPQAYEGIRHDRETYLGVVFDWN